jgi:hypothetical protein
MEAIKLIDAGPEGSVLFELLIDEKFSNLNGMLDVIVNLILADKLKM